MPFIFLAISLANESRVSIPSPPFSISLTGDGEPSLNFPEGDLLINKASFSWDDDAEVLSGRDDDIPTSIPSFVPPKLTEGTFTRGVFGNVSF